jgi:molecular chaperone GrpE
MSKEKKSRVLEDTPENNASAAAAESGASDEIGLESSSDQGETGEKVFIQTEEVDADESSSEVEDPGALNEEIASLKDQLLRKQADFENFRKRMVREREDAIKYANTSLLLDLVEIIDNFERAIKSSEDSTEFESFYDGVVMIEKQFTSMLDSKYGLKRFECIGEEFDPEKHEAIAAVESADVDTQTVTDEFMRGYMLHERVLRHSKVRVAMPSAGPPVTGENEEEEEK